MQRSPRRLSRAHRLSGHHAFCERLERRWLLSTDVLRWHNDLAQTGLNSTETRLTPANVNPARFGKLFSYPVDGQLYAEPLYVSGLNIPGRGTHDVVIVATENNSVYAFDADNSNAATGGGMLWHVNLGTPATLPNPYIYPPGARFGPNITPVVGITGTPVIDRATNTMYVDAFTNDAEGVYNHRIHALDLTTGLDKVTPTLVTATFPGNGVGGDSTNNIFNATRQLQRPALSLVNGLVYVSYGSFSDGDPYHGWVLGFDPATLQLKSVFDTTPNLLTPVGTNPGEGALWQAGAGASSDGTNLYFMTANGDFDASIGDYSDSFIKLATNNNQLSLSDYFTPSNQQQLAAHDQDLGSGGPMVLPDSVGSAAHPHLLVGCGKQGLIYLIDSNNMGGYHTTDAIVQEVSLGSGTWSSPAYFNGSIYFHGSGDVLKAFSISNGILSSSPIARGTVSYNYPGATPAISSNGNADGIVWEIQSNAVLHAYDASTLAEIYNSSMAGTRDQLGSYIEFTVPAIADGEVFVGTENSVAVFGLLSTPNTIIGTSGNDTIVLKQDADHQHIDWTMGSQSGRIAISDANGLTIEGAGGADTITLDNSNGNPLPNRLKLNGTFAFAGSALTIGSAQQINIESSAVSVPHAMSPLTALQSYLRSGLIVSSIAAASGGKLAIADIDNGSQTTLRNAIVGDASTNGSVAFTDLLVLAQHYGEANADWSKGDFNYDGTVDFSDLLALAQRYGQSVASETLLGKLLGRRHR